MNNQPDEDSAPPVKLKGVGDGLWVTLDPYRPEGLLKEELTKLFDGLKNLSVNAKIVIDMGGAKGFDTLFDRIKQHLKQNFSVGSVVKSPETRSAPLERKRQRDMSKGWHHRKSDVLMLRGRVRSGQRIESKKHLVIQGDVNPGAEICAGGDVIVLGKLKGKVNAGYPDNEDAFVLALEFAPTQVQIGGIAAAGMNEGGSKTAEFASVDRGAIVVQDYLKANPFAKMPWPETV